MLSSLSSLLYSSIVQIFANIYISWLVLIPQLLPIVSNKDEYERQAVSVSVVRAIL